MIICVVLASCTKTTVVNNCPVWLESGIVSLSDARYTKEWMARYETNRIRECR